MPHAAQGFFFNLADALAGAGVDAPDFLQRKAFFQADMVHRAIARENAVERVAPVGQAGRI